jgi:hypothetical protein
MDRARLDGGAAVDHYAVKIKGDPAFTDNTIPATRARGCGSTLT